MKKNILIVLALVVVIGLAWWAMSTDQVTAPTATVPADSTAQIQSDLQGLDTGSLDQEFQGIDQDISAL